MLDIAKTEYKLCHMRICIYRALAHVYLNNSFLITTCTKTQFLLRCTSWPPQVHWLHKSREFRETNAGLHTRTDKHIYIYKHTTLYTCINIYVCVFKATGLARKLDDLLTHNHCNDEQSWKKIKINKNILRNSSGMHHYRISFLKLWKIFLFIKP